jgi:hypothetical protein
VNQYHWAGCKYSVCAVLLAFALKTADANEEQTTTSIDAELSKIARDTGLPGITFSVHGPHIRRSFAAGLADRESGTPMLEMCALRSPVVIRSL